MILAFYNSMWVIPYDYSPFFKASGAYSQEVHRKAGSGLTRLVTRRYANAEALIQHVLPSHAQV